VVKERKGTQEPQLVRVKLNDLILLKAEPPVSLRDGSTVTELSIRPSGEVMKAGSLVKVKGQAWQGPRDDRNLRWDRAE
jgi:hypothetical protein